MKFLLIIITYSLKYRLLLQFLSLNYILQDWSKILRNAISKNGIFQIENEATIIETILATIIILITTIIKISKQIAHESSIGCIVLISFSNFLVVARNINFFI
jgi:hypothetical protein